MDINYFPNNGGNKHLVIMPDSTLVQSVAYASSSTGNQSNGYVNSTVRTVSLPTCKEIIAAAFGNDHILTYKDTMITGTDSNGVASTFSITDASVELPMYSMLSGVCAQASGGLDSIHSGNGQFAAMAMNPHLIYITKDFWLRDIKNVSNSYLFSETYYAAHPQSVTSLKHVRPIFALKG